MRNFWEIVNNVIREADVLLLVLDSRLVEQTRHHEIENKVKKANKPLIYVLSKCDLADKKELEKIKKTLSPVVFISATKHFGTTMLRDKILIEAKKAGIDKHAAATVGVLGYPNVGKSSLINAMKGRHAASTSSMSGHTRGVQKIKSDNRIMFLDTPGVIPFDEKSKPVKHALIGTIDFVKEKDPDIVVMNLMDIFPKKIEAHYGVNAGEYVADEKGVNKNLSDSDKEEFLEKIAVKHNMLKKGGKPDIERAARMVLKDWQTGKIQRHHK